MARTRTTSLPAQDSNEHEGGDPHGDTAITAAPPTPMSVTPSTIAAGDSTSSRMLQEATAASIALANHAAAPTVLTVNHDAAIAAAVATGNDALAQAYINLAAHAHITASNVIPKVDPHPQLSHGSGRGSATMALGVSASTGALGHLPTQCPPFQESYNDMGELRRELKILSVRMSLPYFMQHSSPKRLEARCPTWKHRKTAPTSCEFVVSANRHTNGRVYVTRVVLAHASTCPVAASKPESFITAAALMETAKPFMAQVGTDVKPKDMSSIMQDRFGVSTSYMTAWRALSAFKHEQKVAESASFMKIRGYLDAFVASNVGSTAVFAYVPGTTTFERAFLCPKPLQLALQYCCASILLSVFLQTSTHGGVLMTATALDALGEHVPLAIALAPVESEANWRFFLTHLDASVLHLRAGNRTFVHNRGDDLQKPLHELFPTIQQSDAVEQFAHVSSHTPSPLAGVSATSITLAPLPSEHAFEWLETLCSKTPLLVLVGWVSKVASTLYQRHHKYAHVTSEYPPDFHALALEFEAATSHHDVVRIAESGYEVIDRHTSRQRIVDFAKQSCTCGAFDATKFPCLHVYLATAAAGMLHAAVIPYIYRTASLQALYSGRITPIDVETIESDNLTTPLPLPKARGRPRKVHQIHQFSDAKQEKLACSVCGVKGHNKRTCKRSSNTNASSTASTTSSSNSGSAATSATFAPPTAAATGGVEVEDEASTFLDATYVDADLRFDHAALHPQLPIDAETVKQQQQAQVPSLTGSTSYSSSSTSENADSASPATKKRKLAATPTKQQQQPSTAVEPPPTATTKPSLEPAAATAPSTAMI